MVKYNNWDTKHLKSYFDDETDTYFYKTDYEISKIANKITKIPRTVRKVDSYQQETIILHF